MNRLGALLGTLGHRVRGAALDFARCEAAFAAANVAIFGVSILAAVIGVFTLWNVADTKSADALA